MKKIILSFIILVILAGCINVLKKNKDADADQEKTGKDSTGLAAGLKDLSGERKISSLICQRWFNKDDQEAYDNSDGVHMKFPYRSLHFFTDSTMVKYPYLDLGFGKWSFNEADKTIHVQYEDGTKETYLIKAIGVKSMLIVNEDYPKNKIEMISDGIVEKDIKEDPFYYSNNRWRIKPKHAETDEEIKERLRQCIHFYHLYLKDNSDRNESSIMVHGIPSCFIWYDGGIGIKDKDKLDETWIDCFYNKEQAMKAYNIVNELNNKKYNWGNDSTETSWIKQSAPILQQMCDSLK